MYTIIQLYKTHTSHLWYGGKEHGYIMKPYKEMSREELVSLKEELDGKFEEAKSKGLKLDMSRGKQSTAQLDMTMSIMNVFDSDSILKTEDGIDCRNYGLMDGIPEVKKLLGDMMGVPAENVLVYGNSSLSVMP